MYKIAAIGDKDTVTSFKALGIDVFSVENLENDDIVIQKIKATIDKLAISGYGIILITEDYALRAESVLERYKNEVMPIITLIPSNKGSKGIGIAKIDENIEKAIGTNIF